MLQVFSNIAALKLYQTTTLQACFNINITVVYKLAFLTANLTMMVVRYFHAAKCSPVKCLAITDAYLNT